MEVVFNIMDRSNNDNIAMYDKERMKKKVTTRIYNL